MTIDFSFSPNLYPVERGPGEISNETVGAVTRKNGVPAAVKIELRSLVTRRVVAYQVSGNDGTFRFTGLSTTEPFQILLYDPEKIGVSEGALNNVFAVVP